MTPEEIALKTLQAAQRQADAAERQVFWSQVQAVSNFALALIPVGVVLFQVWWQTWREKRLDFGTSYDFRTEGGGKSSITLFNENDRNIHVAYWEILWKERRWPRRDYVEVITRADLEDGYEAFDIAAYTHRSLTLTGERGPFQWPHTNPKAKLCLRVWLVGAKGSRDIVVYTPETA